MNYNRKAIVIEAVILVITLVVAFILKEFFEAKGHMNFAKSCLFIPTTVLGLYFIFGKYVYINGIDITRFRKIACGIFFISIAPLIYFIRVFLLTR